MRNALSNRETKMNKLRFAASVLVLTAFAGGASAQEGTAAIDLTCSDIASLGEAHAAALVYYIAGYQDAQMSAGGEAAAEPAAPAEGETAPAEGAAAPAEGEAPAQQPATAEMVGGVTLSAAAVITACQDSPDMRVADVITAQGGSGAMPVAASAQPPAGGQAEPAQDAQPAEGASAEPATPPAEGAAPEQPAEGAAEGADAPAEGETPAQ